MAVRSGVFNPIFDPTQGKRGRRPGGGSAPVQPPAITSAPTISGTPGGILTATFGPTTNATGSTGEWYRDLLPTGVTTLTIDSSAWLGLLVLVQTATGPGGSAYAMSAAFDNGTNETVVFFDNFNSGTAGDKLSARAGWSVTGGTTTEQDKLVLTTAGGAGSPRLTTTSSLVASGTPAAYPVGWRDIGGTDQAVSTTLLNNVRPLAYYFNGSSDSDYIKVVYGNDTPLVIFVYRVVAGVATQVGQGIPFAVNQSSIVNGDVLRITYKQGRMYVRYGTTEYLPIAGTTPKPGTGGFAVTAVGAGTKAGVSGNTGGGAFGGDNVSFVSFQEPVVFSGSPTIGVDVDGVSVSQAITYTGTPTTFEIAVMGPDGKPLVARTAATVTGMSGGVATVSISSHAIPENTAGLILQVWQDATTLGAAMSFATPVLPAFTNYVPGLNSSDPRFTTLDFARVVQIRDTGVAYAASPGVMPDSNSFDASELGMGNDAVIHQYRSSQSAIVLSMIDAGALPAALQGSYVLSGLPSGIAAAKAGGTMTVTSTTADGIKFTTGTGTFSIQLSGPMPGGGIPLNNIRIVADGTNPTTYLNALAKADYQAVSTVSRFMTSGGINSASYYSPISGLWTGTYGVRGGLAMSLADQIRQCNETGSDFWFNAHDQADDTYITAAATLILANLAPGKTVHVEESNEVAWNQLFAQYHREAAKGASESLSAPVIECSASGKIPGGVTNVPFSTGNYLYGNISGYGGQVFQALKNVPSGTAINGAGDTNFAVIYDLTQTNALRYNHHIRRSVEIVAIFKGVFGAQAGRIRAKFGEFAGNSGATIAAHLGQSEAYKVDGDVALGPYWGSGAYGTADLGKYTSTAIAGWTTTEHALYTSDLTSCVNYFFTGTADDSGDINAGPAMQVVNAIYLGARKQKAELEQNLVALYPDYVRNTIGLSFYEFNHHLVFSGTPGNGWTNATAAQALFAAILVDPRLETVQEAYFRLMKRLGGVQMMFCDYQSSAGVIQSWGMKNKVGEASNPTFDALVASVAG